VATLTELERLVRSVPDPVVRGFLLMADDSIVAVLPYALAIAARLALADACGPDGSTAEELAVAVGFAAEPVMSLMKRPLRGGLLRPGSTWAVYPHGVGRSAQGS
jgi:hypothetical protein